MTDPSPSHYLGLAVVNLGHTISHQAQGGTPHASDADSTLSWLASYQATVPGTPNLVILRNPRNMGTPDPTLLSRIERARDLLTEWLTTEDGDGQKSAAHLRHALRLIGGAQA